MPLTACLLALLSVFTWGMNFVIIKMAVTEMSALGFLSLRFLATAIIFLPFIQALNRQTIINLLIIGLLIGLCHQGLMFAGLQFTEAGTMSILLQTQVLMSCFIGWLFLKEKMTMAAWAGLFTGLIGVTILLGGIDLSTGLRGVVYGLLSALFLAIAFIRMKQLQTIHPASFIGYFNCLAFPFILALAIMIDGTVWIVTLPQMNWVILGPALAFQVFILSLSQIIWQRLLARYPVSKVMAWFLLMPVIGVLSGAALMQEALTWPIVAGGLMTVAGVGLVALTRSR